MRVVNDQVLNIEDSLSTCKLSTSGDVEIQRSATEVLDGGFDLHFLIELVIKNDERGLKAFDENLKHDCRLQIEDEDMFLLLLLKIKSVILTIRVFILYLYWYRKTVFQEQWRS